MNFWAILLAAFIMVGWSATVATLLFEACNFSQSALYRGVCGWSGGILFILQLATLFYVINRGSGGFAFP